MRTRRYALTLALLASAVLLAGCADVNPFKAQASVASQGLDAAGDAQVTGALENSSMAVKGWQAVNGRYPSVAEFGTIDGAAHNGGVTVTYQQTSNGYCLSATSTTASPVTRTFREPGGLQAPGTTC